ncbi:MAG: molybdenum cofactor biosynthesis protein MoaE [Thermoproteota archaeon]
MIRIGEEDFSIDEVVSKLKSRGAGAIVVFTGFVKGFRGGESVDEMIIEAYEKIAEEKLKEIRSNALCNFGIIDAVIIHRIGRLKPMDNIVLVAVSARSRREAFEACSWIISEVKVQAPIWKKELTGKGWIWVRGEERNE